jgi:uncharacterized membrane protein YphA (DoxX/SURF4 family)
MVYLLLGFRWLLAAVLITFGGRKLLTGGIGQLAIDMANYKVLPETLLRPAATLLPWVELGAGLCLALGILLVPAAAGVALLLAVFTVTIAWHLLRGRRFRCGCGDNALISWTIVWRDLALCAAAVTAAVGPSAGLAIWGGPGAGHVASSSATLLPVPFITILIIVCARVLIAGRRLQTAARPGGRRTGRAVV